MGEQPNPWDLSLPPLLVGQDYTFTMPDSCHHERFRCEPCDRPQVEGPISPFVRRGGTKWISRYGRRIPGSLPPCSDAALSIGRSEATMQPPKQLGLPESSFPRGEPYVFEAHGLLRFGLVYSLTVSDEESS